MQFINFEYIKSQKYPKALKVEPAIEHVIVVPTIYFECMYLFLPHWSPCVDISKGRSVCTDPNSL